MGKVFGLQLLGPALVERDGQPVHGLESGKGLGLLGYLAVRDQPASRDHLADLFWSDKTAARGRANLSWMLHRIASLLPGCLETTRYTVRFRRIPSCQLDLDAFEALVTEGDATALAAAVELYRGDFLTGLYLDGCADFEVWLVGEQERWRRQVTRALRDLIAHHGQSGRYREGLRYARRLLALEPWREQVHQQVMQLLALDGQRGAALAQYETCRRVLDEELGVEPGTATTRLYERIRDSTLTDPVPPSVRLPVLDLSPQLVPCLNEADSADAERLLMAA